MIYLIVVILILFGIFWFDYRGIKTGKLIYWILICLLLIFIAGLRYRLGQDTITYIQDFSDLHPISKLKSDDFLRTRFAPGYVIVTSVFKEFTSDFTWFQLFQSAIINSVVFYFFYKYCRHIFFSALIYFFYLYFLFTFQQIREAFAVSVFLLAWPFFKNNKWIYWYISSLLAVFFHISAIIMFFLPLICLPVVRQFFIFGRRTWVVAISVFILSIVFQAIFFKYIELIAFSASMLERIKNYEHNILGGSILNLNGVMGTLFQYILYPILALYFLQRRKVLEGKDVFKFDKFNAYVLLSVFIAIFSISVTIVGRLNNYFFPFAILALSDWLFGYFIVKKKKYKLRLVYWILIFLPMFSFHISGTYLNDLNRSGTLKSYMVYYPYTSVFDKNIDPKTDKAIHYIRRRI